MGAKHLLLTHFSQSHTVANLHKSLRPDNLLWDVGEYEERTYINSRTTFAQDFMELSLHSLDKYPALSRLLLCNI